MNLKEVSQRVVLESRYALRLRRLTQRRKNYEELSSDEQKQTGEVQQRGELRDVVHVGACRAISQPIKELFAQYIQPDIQWNYLSGFLKTVIEQNGRRGGRKREEVVAAFDADQHDYASVTDTPLFDDPFDFNTHLLMIARNGQKILQDPQGNLEDTTHRNWILSSASSIQSFIQTGLISFDELDENGKEWACFSFLDEPYNTHLEEFRSFVPEFTSVYGTDSTIIQIHADSFSPTAVPPDDAQAPTQMYTIKVHKDIYNKFNSCYYKKKKRPPFTLGLPMYVPGKNTSIYLQTGTDTPINDIRNPQTRAQMLERVMFDTLQYQEQPQPFFISSASGQLQELVNAQLEEFLAQKQLEIPPKRAAIIEDAVIGLVAHEFRTPLTAIKGYADVLLNPPTQLPPGLEREFHTVIKNNAERMLETVEPGLRTLRDLRFDRLEFLNPANLFPALLEDNTRKVNATRTDRQIDIQYDFPDRSGWKSFPEIATIGFTLKSITENLLNNALKYGLGSKTSESEPERIKVVIRPFIQLVQNPDTGVTEPLVLVAIDCLGKDFPRSIMRKINDRTRTDRIREDETGKPKEGGQGMVLSRIVMDNVNNNVANPDVLSIFYRAENISALPNSSFEGARTILGFRLRRTLTRDYQTDLAQNKVVAIRSPHLFMKAA